MKTNKSLSLIHDFWFSFQIKSWQTPFIILTQGFYSEIFNNGQCILGDLLFYLLFLLNLQPSVHSSDGWDLHIYLTYITVLCVTLCHSSSIYFPICAETLPLQSRWAQCECRQLPTTHIPLWGILTWPCFPVHQTLCCCYFHLLWLKFSRIIYSLQNIYIFHFHVNRSVAFFFFFFFFFNPDCANQAY